MTDQKSDRQDGDGLQELAGRFPEVNPGNYNDLDVEALNNWGIEVVTEIRSTPTRDGAEGAGTSPIGQSDVEMLRHLADSMGFGRTHDMLRRVIAATPYLSTPPKPAPDAMREALLDAQEGLRGLLAWTGATRNGVLSSGDRVAFEDDLKIALKARATVDRALSAPVPPADGALATGILNSLEETAKYLRRADPATIDMDGATSILLAGIKQLRPFASLSPAVAAEPVVWRWKYRNVENLANAAWHMTASKIESSGNIIAEPLYASPLVRGNREAICEAIRAYCRTLGKTVVHTSSDGIDRIYYSGLSVQGIADAVIPVQPGAGERDICPYCDSEMEKDACSACGRERMPLEGLSRQAPHSSSEGGR